MPLPQFSAAGATVGMAFVALSPNIIMHANAHPKKAKGFILLYNKMQILFMLI